MQCHTEFTTSAAQAFQYNKSLAERAAAQLADDKLRVPLDDNTNSIAVIMKHVAGNLRSRFTDFLTADGEKPWRDRDDEFVDTLSNRDDLLEHWELGWNCLFETLAALTEDDLARSVVIRGEPHSVPLAIHRSIGHTGYHTGQIVMIARILAKDDWRTLTIERGASQQYNQKKWGGKAWQ